MSIVLPSLSAGSSGAANSIAAVNAAINQQKTNIENVVNGIQGFDALLWNNSTATLATDTLSLTSKPRVIVLDTEGAAATDNLSTISNGTAYQMLWLKAANAGRVITVKHNVGNIKLTGSGDLVLSNTTWLMLFYDGTQWTDATIPSQPKRATLFHDEATVIAGNALATTVSTTAPYNYYVSQTPSAVNDSFTHSFWLPPGTYTFSVLGVTAVNCGQIDWYFDTVKLISLQDWYSGSSIFNVVKTASVTISGYGAHQLKGIVSAKNGSSSGYYMDLTKYWLKQASD